MQNDMIHAWTSPATPRSFQTVQFHALPARQPMLSKKVVRPRLPHQPGCPLYHQRNSNARTRPTAEDLHAERHDTRMDVASDAQIVPDRAVPCSTRSPADAVQESCGQGYHTSRDVHYIIHATPTQERSLPLKICMQNDMIHAWTSPATPRSFQTVQFHALPARQPMLSKKVAAKVTTPAGRSTI